MEFSASLLDYRFVLLLLILGFTRPFWPKRYFALFGALFSVVAIGLAAPKTLAVIAGITLLYLYPLHRVMKAAADRGASKGTRRAILGSGVAGMVFLLLWFKLYRHFTIPWLSGPWLNANILALVGFSYFIFRAINFLHIQAILPIDERTPWPLLWFTLFPPTLTSGPIQKFQDFRQQLAQPVPLSGTLLSAVIYRLTRGYFRKMVIAYTLNEIVGKLLGSAQMTIITSTLAICCLYLYFYYDFAGYSDIAIGFGLLMGIKVPENFRQPFSATTVSEFWRNYHITLVDWFRDQVFIPLGGMRATRFYAACLAFLVMILCGLWHGVTLSFFAWGLWHGLLLFSEALVGSRPVPPPQRHGISYWSRVLWTNARVAFGAVFFSSGHLVNYQGALRIRAYLMSFTGILRSRFLKWCLMSAALFWASVYKWSEQKAKLPEFVYVNF